MKKRILAVLALVLSFSVFAQAQDPVVWSYSAKKKSANTYEVTLSARLDDSWHIYSVNTPKGGPVATKINFKKNPLVSVEGVVKENGKLETMKDKLFSVDVKYYSDRVDFVQLVKVKGNIKTNVAGTVQYMVCDDTQCLPPTTKNFDIKLQ
jgi:hypothetical protein